MAELVKVYENDDIANDDLGCYVAKNQEIVERVIPRKNNLWGSKIELSHLIELTALEQDGSLGYFLNDGVLSIGTENDGSDMNPYKSIDQLALKVKERIKYQRERCERETRCEVNILPIIYTVEVEARFDENFVQNNFGFLSRVLGRNIDLLSTQVKEESFQELERGLTEEERKLFERAYNQI